MPDYGIYQGAYTGPQVDEAIGKVLNATYPITQNDVNNENVAKTSSVARILRDEIIVVRESVTFTNAAMYTKTWSYGTASDWSPLYPGSHSYVLLYCEFSNPTAVEWASITESSIKAYLTEATDVVLVFGRVGADMTPPNPTSDNPPD